jgi:Zn-dependent alcohol dehydrogenase
MRTTPCRAGKLKLDGRVTRCLALDQVNQAREAFASGQVALSVATLA